MKLCSDWVKKLAYRMAYILSRKSQPIVQENVLQISHIFFTSVARDLGELVTFALQDHAPHVTTSFLQMEKLHDNM